MQCPKTYENLTYDGFYHTLCSKNLPGRQLASNDLSVGQSITSDTSKKRKRRFTADHSSLTKARSINSEIPTNEVHHSLCEYSTTRLKRDPSQPVVESKRERLDSSVACRSLDRLSAKTKRDTCTKGEGYSTMRMFAIDV